MAKWPLAFSAIAVIILFATGQTFYAWLVLAVLIFALIYKLFETIIKGGKNSATKPVTKPVVPELNQSDAPTPRPQKTTIPTPLIERKTRKEKFCTECGSQRMNNNDLFCVSCGSRFDSQDSLI